jgi:hypothetical protein
MQFHPCAQGAWLAQPSDLDGRPVPAPLRAHVKPVARLLRWADEYLCRPHPDLGRDGPVCPFTRPALRRDLLFVGVLPGAPSPAEVEAAVRTYRDWLPRIAPVAMPGAQYKFIALLLPDLPAAAWTPVIDGTHERLKVESLAAGMMIGEFHPGPPDKGGLWNPAFRPLECPVPMIGIRHLAASDLVFLQHDRHSLAAWLAHFGDALPPRMHPAVAAAAARVGLTLPLLPDPVLMAAGG